MEYCLYVRTNKSKDNWLYAAGKNDISFLKWWSECPVKGIKEVYANAATTPHIIYIDSKNHDFDFGSWLDWQNKLPIGTNVIDFWIGNIDKKPKKQFKASDIQVGGDHYKNFKIQPIEFICKNNIGFIEGNVIKYITRYKHKNGLEDLKKVKHYVDLLIEMEYPEGVE